MARVTDDHGSVGAGRRRLRATGLVV